MDTQGHPRFFITHSWRDNDFVQKLVDDLIAKGFRGFIDIYAVKAGDDIPSEREINAAFMLNGERGRPRIIPVLADDCLSKLPPLLKPLLSVNFVDRYDSALRELLGGIDDYRKDHERKNRSRLLLAIFTISALLTILCVIGIVAPRITPLVSSTTNHTSITQTSTKTVSILLPPDKQITPSLTSTFTPFPPSLTPTWTPTIGPTSKNRIAFHSTKAGPKEIYSIGTDGQGMIRLTSGTTSQHGAEPAWSLANGQIAFRSDRDKTGYEIYVMNPDGKGLPTPQIGVIMFPLGRTMEN